MKNFYKTGIIAAFVFFGGLSSASAQKDGIKKPQFSIFIKTTVDGITLTCNKGCEWKEVSFKTPNQDGQYSVDESGAREITKKDETQATNDSPFYFILHRLPQQLILTGHKGVSWKTLKIECPDNNCTETVDDDGITQLN